MIRPYQTLAIELIRNEFRKHKRVLLWLATGSGKTTCFCKIIKAAAEKNNSAIVLVRGRKLVDQASKRLDREGVPHGIMMASKKGMALPIQVCSVDTLIARGIRPPAKLIVIDECHMASSKGYKTVLDDYPDAFILSVTATPWVDSGLRHVADSVVHPITMQGLIDEGYLIPFRSFAPSKPNLSGVKISSSTKDYVVDDLSREMIKSALTGNIVSHWEKIASDRPTLCFSVNVKHSKFLVDRFTASGIHAEHIDATSNDWERNNAIHRLERGEIKVLSNVGILSVGVDIPSVGAIIMARPTRSRNLFIQQAGRGTRPFAGLQDCILLDHANNIKEHGFPTEEPEVYLDGKKKSETAERGFKTCPGCFAIFVGKVCPECGGESETETAVPIEGAGELVELKIDPINKAFLDLKKEARRTGKKTAWVYYTMVNRFGFDVARPYLPFWFIQKQENIFGNSPYQGIKK